MTLKSKDYMRMTLKSKDYMKMTLKSILNDIIYPIGFEECIA
jgi:hypothetical protein